MSNQLHHIIIPVTDMTRSLYLFEHLLGFTLIWRLPKAGGKEMSRALGIANMEAEMAFLQAPDKGPALELVRFLNEDPLPEEGFRRENPTFGFSVAVDDLDRLHERLGREGWPPLSEPMVMPTPEGKPTRIFCIRNDEGLIVEFVEQGDSGLG